MPPLRTTATAPPCFSPTTSLTAFAPVNVSPETWTSATVMKLSSPWFAPVPSMIVSVSPAPTRRSEAIFSKTTGKTSPAATS